MNCMVNGCTTSVRECAGYCLRHGGMERLCSERNAQKEKQKKEQNNQRQKRRSLFDATGRVRPGQGLKRCAEVDRKARQERERLEAIRKAQLHETYTAALTEPREKYERRAFQEVAQFELALAALAMVGTVVEAWHRLRVASLREAA